MAEITDFTAEQEAVLRTHNEGKIVCETERLNIRLSTRHDVVNCMKEANISVLEAEHVFQTTVLYLTTPTFRILVGEDKELKQDVGGIMFYDPEKNRNIHLGIKIYEDFQNRGYGQELMKAAIEYARNAFSDMVAELLLTVDVRNTRAIHVYEKSGFSKIGSRSFIASDDGSEQTEFIMKTPL
jgi:RimJ/RimL family protein N-acetyltransferase